MSELSDRVTVVGEPTGERQNPSDLVGARSVREYLRDDETVEFAVVGTDDGLVRETDDWQTTESPGSASGVVVLVTDRHVVFAVGDCRDPDVDGDYVRHVDHAAVEDVTVTNSLLSTGFTVATEDVRLTVTPRETDGLDDVARYVERAQMQWRSAEEFFDGLGDELRALENEVADGDDASARRRRHEIQNGLSELGQTSSLHAVELPALESDRDRIQQRLDDALCRGYWYRARERTNDARQRRESGAVADAAAAYRDACDEYQSMVEFGGPRAEAFEDDALELANNPFDLEGVLANGLASCGQTLQNGAEPETGATAWPALLAGYEHLLSAVRIGGDRLDTDPDELRATVERVRQRTVDAYVEAAERFEERGDASYDDGDDDEADDRYDRARELLAEGRELADAHEEVATDSVEECADRIEEKRERSQWEWGGSQ